LYISYIDISGLASPFPLRLGVVGSLLALTLALGVTGADQVPVTVVWGTLLVSPGADLDRDWILLQRTRGASPQRLAIRAAASRAAGGVFWSLAALLCAATDLAGASLAIASTLVAGALGTWIVSVVPRRTAVLPLAGLIAVLLPIATHASWLDPNLLRGEDLSLVFISSLALGAALVLASALLLESRTTRP